MNLNDFPTYNYKHTFFTSYSSSVFSFLIYLLPPCSSVLLENLTGSQGGKKFSAFYGIRRFITAFIKCPLLAPILSQINPVHVPPFNFLKIHFSINLSSMTGSPKWSLSLKSPHQLSIHLFFLSYVLHAPPISLFSILSPEQYWVRSINQ